MTDWQPIETAPRDRKTEILLWFPWQGLSVPGCYFIGIWGYANDESAEEWGNGPMWVDPNNSNPLGEPTHWMPLPTPPSPLTGEGGGR